MRIEEVKAYRGGTCAYRRFIYAEGAYAYRGDTWASGGDHIGEIHMGIQRGSYRGDTWASRGDHIGEIHMGIQRGSYPLIASQDAALA